MTTLAEYQRAAERFLRQHTGEITDDPCLGQMLKDAFEVIPPLLTVAQTEQAIRDGLTGKMPDDRIEKLIAEMYARRL